MPEESTTPDLVELTRSLFEAAHRRDIDAILRFYDPDAVFDMSPTGMGTFEGRAAVRGFLEDWIGSYEEFEMAPEEILDLGSGVVLGVITLKGRPAGSSGHVRLRYAAVGLWAQGLIVRATNYLDIDEGRQATERLAASRAQGMSRENVEIAKRGLDAYNRLDVDPSAELMTPDFEWFPAMPEVVEGGVYRGREGIETYFEEIRTTWTELRIVGNEFRDLGDRVLFLGRVEGRGIGSGVQVDAPIGIVIDFRGGKILRSRGYFDHGEALRAAGLSEQATSANLDLVRSISFERDESDERIVELFDPAIVLDNSTLPAPTAGVYRGHEGLPTSPQRTPGLDAAASSDILTTLS